MENHCLGCHDGETQKGKLNLESLGFELGQGETFNTWVLVHDKVQAGEMPPKKKQRPEANELASFLKPLAAA
ncbi:MAG: c-type cytochrome domain-containing protein, partial [Verrucomicrobiota bacterium]|nr:c-type cytochrome domain-containing protein [Verrucomicrobiota bacterium]